MVVFTWKVDKKCNFVNLPFMTIDEVLVVWATQRDAIYGNGHWGWIQFHIDLGLGKMICIYIYMYISSSPMMKTCIDKAQPQIRKQNPCQQVNWKAVSQVFLQFCGIAWIGNRL